MRQPALRLVPPILFFVALVCLSIAVDRNLLAWLDQAAGFWVEHQITASRTTLMFAITDLAAAIWILATTLFLGIALGIRRQGYWVRRLALTVPTCMLSVELVKWLFQRARPIIPNPLLELENYSFPSGHAASAMALYGFVAILICSIVKRTAWRVFVGSVAVSLIVGVAFSRVYLGVHYVTDVIGGVLLGLAWLTLAGIIIKHRGAVKGS